MPRSATNTAPSTPSSRGATRSSARTTAGLPSIQVIRTFDAVVMPRIKELSPIKYQKVFVNGHGALHSIPEDLMATLTDAFKAASIHSMTNPAIAP